MKKFDKILSCKVFKKKVLFNLEHNWGFYIAISNDNILNFELFDKKNKKVVPKLINEKNHVHKNTNVSKYKNYYVVKMVISEYFLNFRNEVMCIFYVLNIFSNNQKYEIYDLY